MSNKLRNSAKGQQCLVRLPGICCWNEETVVLAHLPSGAKGLKSNDIHGAFCCHTCHAALDGHVKTEFTKEYLSLAHHEGVVRTQKYWIENGFIKDL